MDVIWTLVVFSGVVFFPVPGSTQDSRRTLFLISVPEVLHAGTPTPLAVTVLADFPGRVMVEVKHGSMVFTKTEDFKEIHESTSPNSLLNLTVRGYKEDNLIFTNTTTVTFNPRNVSSVIQTDKSCYQPGDTVRVRVVSVQLNNHPYKGRVDISIQDPTENVVYQWESTGNLGIVLREFSLSPTSLHGHWTITAAVNGVIDEKAFIVEHYDPPHFEMLFKTPLQILVGDDISGSVRALYPSGQPVRGTLTISVSMASDVHNTAYTETVTQTKLLYGSTQFVFGKEKLQGISGRVRVDAFVTDIPKGFKVNKTVEVDIMTKMFQLTFHDFPSTLKPSLHFSAKLRISRYDRNPLSSQDLKPSAVIEVTQSTNTGNAVPTTLTLPVPEDGNIHIQFELQDQVDMLFIQVSKIQSSEETLTVYKNQPSPSGSYIQISPVSTTPAQIGLPLLLQVKSTLKPTGLHFLVSSRGQVVSAGTKNSSSFSLTPTLSWSPEACVTVYCILSDGEVASDTAHIPINKHNDVSLSWNINKAQPGEQVWLTVNALETRSQVGIVVIGEHDGGPQADLDLKVEKQDCNIRMLTNARLYKKKQPDGPENGDAQVVERFWSRWMDASESLLWFNTIISDQPIKSEKITVPDGVTSLRAAALVISDSLGLGFTPVPQKLTVSKDFSLSLDVPSYLIRREEIVLEVNIINHLDYDIQVILLLATSEAYEFVLADKGDVSVVNAQKLTLGSHVSASALFPIRPVALGEIEISVDAVSAEASDSLVWRVLVKPEGVEQSFSETLFLEVEPLKFNSSTSISFSFPPDVVPGSQRAHVALVGDILGFSIRNLGSLLQMPLGNGEQNMIHFAPNIYVLQYLDKSIQDDVEIRSRALGYMLEVYQKQLSYQREDGSFSPFGASDTSGSIWLTAFVLKCFLQARPYMQVDQSVLTRAVTWLLKHQGPQGEFREVGKVIHTEMQEALDNGQVALTAFVMMALLEDDSYADMYPGNLSLAQSYLENKAASGGISNYSLCLTAYALALANSPAAEPALDKVSSRADYKAGVMMWTSSASLEPHNLKPSSAQIEMASYVLLALYKRGSFVEAIQLLIWLAKQRNHLGGYRTTQDTVVALEALACYAAFSGANAIDLRLNITAPESQFSSLFSINSYTYLTYQSREINTDTDINLNIYMEGRGFAVFQMNIFYNLDSKVFSQILQHDKQEEAFTLDVDVTDEIDHDHLMLSICTRLKNSVVVSHTGMVILEVGMLSGFSLSPGAAAPTELIRKVDILPEKVSFYLDSLNKSEVCIILPLIRKYKVARVHDAMVKVYDYSEPTRGASQTYNSDDLHNMKACSYCGENCDRCRPGITITMSSPLLSSSKSSNDYSIPCLFLCVTALFIRV
ncbi:CD109 antigen-like [Eleginops maclovinus]